MGKPSWLAAAAADSMLLMLMKFYADVADVIRFCC
jgi:hypothetical protein